MSPDLLDGATNSPEHPSPAVALVKQAMLTADRRGMPIRDGCGHLVRNFVDAKRMLLRKPVLDETVRCFWKAFGHMPQIQLASSDGVAGVLCGALLSHAPVTDASALFIRLERKQTGLGRLIEGKTSAAPCIIVDDIINSGATVERLFLLLRSYGVNVVGAFAVFCHENSRALPKFDQMGFQPRYLLSRRDFGLDPVKDRTVASKPVSIVWRNKPKVHAFGLDCRTQVIVDDESLTLSGPYGQIQAIRLVDGIIRWSRAGYHHDELKNLASPIIADGTLLASGQGGQSLGLNPDTGDVIWHHSFGDRPLSSPVMIHQGIVVQAFLLDLASNASRVVAVHLQSGRLSSAIEMPLQVSTNPAAFGGSIWFGTHTGEVVEMALDISSFRIQKVAASPIATILPRIADKSLYVVTVTGEVFAYEKNARESRLIGKFPGIAESAPRLDAQRAIFAAGRTWLHRLDLRSGELTRSRRFAAGRLRATPVICGNYLYAADTAGWLYKLDRGLDPICSYFLDEGVIGLSQVPAAVDKLIAVHSTGAITCVSLD